MLILSIIVKFAVLWIVLSALINTIIGTGWAVFGKIRRCETVNLRVVCYLFAVAFAYHAVLPVLQNMATMAGIYRNVESKFTAWNFKRRYPNVERGDFQHLAQGAL